MDERNGFRIKSWSDVLAVLVIVTMLASAITWALSLQAGKEDHERRITRLESTRGE
jgi:hypothetical protein